MKITAELVNAVLAKSGPDNLGKTLEYLQGISEQVAAARQRTERARQDYQKASDDLRRQLEAVQQTCPHPLMLRKSTPLFSGSDSYSECVVCGLVKSNDRDGYDGKEVT